MRYALSVHSQSYSLGMNSSNALFEYSIQNDLLCRLLHISLCCGSLQLQLGCLLCLTTASWYHGVLEPLKTTLCECAPCMLLTTARMPVQG